MRRGVYHFKLLGTKMIDGNQATPCIDGILIVVVIVLLVWLFVSKW
jgi:hypothetical protein